jgi:hypothetical protein
MKENISNKQILNYASIAGAILGGVSIAYMIVTQQMTKIDSALVITLLTLVLWLAKFMGCIYIMRHFMKKLNRDFSEVVNKDTMRLGLYGALFSALIVDAYSFANLEFINPDFVKEQMNAVYEVYGSLMDSNTMQVMETFENKLPIYSFFSNLIYCFLYGTVLSAILSKNIPSRDPFAEE